MKKLISSLAIMTLALGVASCAKVEEEVANATGSEYTEYNAAPSGSAGNLTGTAAVGAPIPNGIVKILCDDKALPDAATDAFGKWKVDVTSCTAPYLVRIKGSVGGKEVDLLSAADTEDVGAIVNVTPLTHMIVANMVADVADADTLFTKFETGAAGFTDLGAKVSKAKLNAEAAKIKTALENVIKAATGKSDISDIDLMNMPFATDHSGMDAVLDVIKVEQNAGSFEVKLADASGTALFTDDPAADDAPAAVAVTASDITNIVETYQSADQVLRDLIKYAQANASAINSAQSVAQLPAGYEKVYHSSFLDRGSDARGALHEWFGLRDMAEYRDNLEGKQADFANVNIKLGSVDGFGIIFFDFILDGKLMDKGISLPVAKENSVWKLYGDQIPFEFHAGVAVTREYAWNGSAYAQSDIIKLEMGFDDGAEVGTVEKVKITNAGGDVIANLDMSFEDWNGNGTRDPGSGSDEPLTITNGVMVNGAWSEVTLDTTLKGYFDAGAIGEYKIEFLDSAGSIVGTAKKVLLADPKLMDHALMPSVNFTTAAGTDALTAANLPVLCDNAETSFGVSLGTTEMTLNHFYAYISGDSGGSYETNQDFDDDSSATSFSVDGSNAGLSVTSKTYKNFGVYLRSSSEIEYAIKVKCN